MTAPTRTRLRDAETKLSEAQEAEAALTEVKAENAKLERSLVVASVARKYDLSEELEADAKALQALVTPATPPALGGGLTPSDDRDDGEMGPRKLARRSRRF